MEADYALVRNYAELISIYGEWPSFHDAEVRSLLIDRVGPRLDLTLYVFRTCEELNDQGQFKRSDECLVLLRFHAITELSLSDFNEQNVLSDLSLVLESKGKRVQLHGLYGLSGGFLCEEIEVCGVERLPVQVA